MVHLVRRHMRAVGLVGADRDRIRGDHHLQHAVAVHVPQPDVVVVQAGCRALIIGQLRPSRSQRTRVLQHPDVDPVQSRLPHDDLHIAVAVQVGHRQRAQLVAGNLPIYPTRRRVSGVIIDGHVPAPLRDHHLQVAVPIHIGDHHTGPHPAAGRVDLVLQAPILAVEHKERVGRADHLHRPVAIKIGHGRRRIPPRLTPRRVAPTVLPLEHRRLHRLRPFRRIACRRPHPRRTTEGTESHNQENEPPPALHNPTPFPSLVTHHSSLYALLDSASPTPPPPTASAATRTRRSPGTLATSPGTVR